MKYRFLVLLVAFACVVISVRAIFPAYAATAAIDVMISPPSTVASLTGPPIQFGETGDYVKLNFTMFAVEFYKGSAGYNKIYDKFGNVLVYDDRIVLQYFARSQWKQRGTPTGISWVKVSDYYYNVTRFYDDYLGTTYNITYTVKSDSPMKISVSLRSGQTDEYRLYWAPSGITKELYQIVGNGIEFFDESDIWIGFDWNDVYQFFGSITSASVESVAQGRKANIYFNIGMVNAEQTIIVDPSIIGTPTVPTATSYASQRKTFYDSINNRYWVWYSDGTNMVYRTSTDGSTWSSETTVRACTSGQQFSIFWDDSNSKVHYAYATGGSNTPLYYGRGTVNGPGNGIDWDKPEQIAVGPSSFERYYYPSIAVDSSGYPFIGYRYRITLIQTDNYPYVTKSSTNDGTWVTESVFPYQLSSTSSSTWKVNVIPLTSQRVYVFYVRSAATQINGRLWTGSWQGPEAVSSSSIAASERFSAVNEGDDIHLVFVNTDLDINHIKRTYGTGWGSEVVVQSSTTSTTAPVLSIDTDNNHLYCFWGGSPTADNIYYKEYDGSSWDASPTDWIDESSTGLTGNDRLTCFYQSYGGYTGLVYMTGSANPFYVRFAFLSANTDPPSDPPSIPEFGLSIPMVVSAALTIYMLKKRRMRARVF